MLKRRRVHETPGGFFGVDEVTRSDGRTRQFMTKGYAVVFLVHDPVREKVIFCSQVREAIQSLDDPDGVSFEAFAGHLDGSDIIDNVVRELHEESRIKIRRMQVTLIYPGVGFTTSPGCTNERIHGAYVQLDPGQFDQLQKEAGNAEEGEQITTQVYDAPELRTLVVPDLKTQFLIQWFTINVLDRRIRIEE